MKRKISSGSIVFLAGLTFVISLSADSDLSLPGEVPSAVGTSQQNMSDDLSELAAYAGIEENRNVASEGISELVPAEPSKSEERMGSVVSGDKNISGGMAEGLGPDISEAGATPPAKQRVQEEVEEGEPGRHEHDRPSPAPASPSDSAAQPVEDDVDKTMQLAIELVNKQIEKKKAENEEKEAEAKKKAAEMKALEEKRKEEEARRKALQKKIAEEKRANTIIFSTIDQEYLPIPTRYIKVGRKVRVYGLVYQRAKIPRSTEEEEILRKPKDITKSYENKNPFVQAGLRMMGGKSAGAQQKKREPITFKVYKKEIIIKKGQRYGNKWVVTKADEDKVVFYNEDEHRTEVRRY